MQGLGVGGYDLRQQQAQSPAEIAEQQKRWEKDQAEREAAAYQAQVAHAALMLLTGPSGARFDAQSALKTAHEVFQGAKAINR